MMKPIAYYKWQCLKCASLPDTHRGRMRGKSSKNWMARYLVNCALHKHIRNYHRGEPTTILIKRKKIDGTTSEWTELF